MFRVQPNQIDKSTKKQQPTELYIFSLINPDLNYRHNLLKHLILITYTREV